MNSQCIYLIILVIASLCWQSCSHKVENSYADKNSMDVSSELSNPCITAFAQDTTGMMWIGTRRGLNRYDSHEYHRYFHNSADSASIPANVINCLFVDSNGRLWVGTPSGVAYYTDKENFHRIPTNARYSLGHQIWQSSEGEIFVNSIEQLCRYDEEKDSLLVVIENFDPQSAHINNSFYDNEGNLWSVINQEIRCYDSPALTLDAVYQTDISPHYSVLLQNGELWVASGRDIKIFDTESRAFKQIPESFIHNKNWHDPIISYIYSQNKDVHFIYTSEGMFKYDSRRNEVLHESSSQFPFDFPGEDLSRMFIDASENIWFGFKERGFELRHQKNERFNSNRTLTEGLKNVSVSSLSFDSISNALWIASANRGIFRYDITNKNLKHISSDVFTRLEMPDVLPPMVLADSQGRIWVIHNELLYECRYFPNGELHIVRVCTEIPKKATFITANNNGSLIVGTASNNLFVLEKHETQFRPLRMEVDKLTMLYCIAHLRNGNYVLSMAFQEPIYSDVKKNKWRYLPMPTDKARRPDLYTSIFEDSTGKIWIGTRGSGLFRYDFDTDTSVKIDGIAGDEICNIIEDDNGNIWISTYNGIAKYNSANETIVNYFTSDGIGGNQFAERSGVKLPSGEIVFGGLHGVTVFNPSYNGHRSNIPLVFEDLRIGNNIIEPGGSIIDMPLSGNPIIRLDYNDNNFSISFSALDYLRQGRPDYYYRLRGYNDNWINLKDNRTVYFTQIPPGNYVFDVKIVDNDFNIEEVRESLNIEIAPAPWETWWAKLFYILLIIGALVTGILIWRRIYHAKRRQEILEMEKEHERRVNKMNMNFFANVSHEFRTPLTMIAGPVTQLAKEPALSETGKQLVGTIDYNSKRMLRLINQMMDFNRLENDALKLQVREEDVISVICNTLKSFRYSMESKNITFKTFGLEDSYRSMTDADKLDKVMFNLMSNALKYTPEGGEITCSFDVDNGKIVIVVTDNGISIPDDKLERIFERYYQVEGQPNYGTGIGLYYSRRLMEMHHGTIQAANMPDGKGVKFTLTLPATDVYTPDEHAPGGQSIVNSQENLSIHPDDKKAANHDDNTPVLMVVDDNPDVIAYLRELLGSKYNVLYSFDAKSALETIQKEHPDMVISDVAMPEMDGYELCKAIKDNISISHIPVILVTAKTSKTDTLTGLHSGAEAYITKPFDPDYLMALIDSLLSNRAKLRGVLSQVTSIEEFEEEKTSDIVLTAQDKAFLDELFALMERELSNSELNVNGICEAMRISRSKLYYKIKGLTGEKPNTFFRTFKLNKAAELLKTGEYNISEVGYMTGFSSPTIFTRNFKAQFGITPTEYISSEK